ncbi:rhomboid family intramembrane serine protease, partial [Cellulomonas sp. NPDC057328]|uniref:rhomboid family intramembrane serine protease n=1 Tax=Cellulomonas sp. NPDC057328 TaxID=3346101 RepID=UPI0036357E67
SLPEPPADQPPVCPRHPDRVAYTTCQRCGRPACPDCQVPAAVGFHCVDCVAQAARTAPEQRTALGAPVRRGRPVVTLALIGICVVAYVLQRTVPGFTDRLAFLPYYGAAEPWRFLTSAFLHAPGQLLHIAFNMVALWMVGPYLEQTLGRARYVTLYLLSAVGGSVGALALATATDGWLTWLVGASGAVFGLFGAVLVVLRRLGRDARGIVGVLVLNGVLGFVLPGISWQAHLGGLVIGAALGAAYAYAPKERRRLVAVLAPVVVGVVLVGVSLAVYASAGFR